MRQGSNNGRRPRGRTNRKQHGGGGGGGQPRTHTFDSNGPDGRVRGNARQVFEKYLSLARDATSAGDRITDEAYSSEERRVGKEGPVPEALRGRHTIKQQNHNSHN